MGIRLIKRLGPPNHMDHAPQGTHCYIMLDDYSADVYIQTSSDEEEPDWHYMGVKDLEELLSSN